MSAAFASYATSSAFRIDLSTRMVRALLALANGDDLTSAHFGAAGLLSRGLVEMKPQQPVRRAYAASLQITPEGMLVARLCESAGLGRIESATQEQAA